METSAFVAATSAIARRSFDATITALDSETSALNAETSVRDVGARRGVTGDISAEFPATSALSFQRYRRGVSGDISDYGVGITLQMCNRVTNHGDMSTFSKPASL